MDRKTNSNIAHFPPRILIMADNMSAGGMERQIIELLKGIKQTGHYRTLLAVFDQGDSREAEARKYVDAYLTFPRRWRFDFTPVFRLVQQLRSMDIKLIHTYGWMSGVAGLMAAKLLGLPIINGGFREAPTELGLRGKINRWCGLHSTMMVSNSNASLKAYRLSGHPRAKVIYNGMDFNRFTNVLPKQYGEQTICMVANFSPYKDHPSMIQAFSLVRQQFPDVRLILVGQDIGTLKEIQSLVFHLGLDHCVTFVTNTIQPESIVAGCQIGVLSTYGESFSNALLEYMMLGKPVITNDSDGTRELVQEGKTGLLVAKQSPKALAEAIIYLLSHPHKAQEMGQAGHIYVRERFPLNRMVSEYEQLYNNILSTTTA